MIEPWCLQSFDFRNHVITSSGFKNSSSRFRLVGIPLSALSLTNAFSEDNELFLDISG